MASVTRFITPTQLLDQIKTVDGSGSGLDADTLDGLSSLAFIKADGTVTGATSQAQTFTNGVASPSTKPLSDTATGWRLYKSNGSTILINADFVSDFISIANNAKFGAYASNGINTVSFFTYNSSNSVLLGPIAAAAGPNDTYVSAGRDLYFRTNGATGTFSVPVAFWANGRCSFSHINTATAAVDAAASTTTAASLRIRSGTRPTTPNAGDFWDDGATVLYQTSAATNTIVNSLKLERGSSGTPAAGFGLGFVAQLKSSTTVTQDVGRLTWEWSTATHASRASKGQLTSYYTSTERPAITWGSDSSVALLSFYDVTTPIARQVLATGASATVDDVITALQALGLVKQS